MIVRLPPQFAALLSLTLPLVLAAPARAQAPPAALTPPPPLNRPRIGLALAGGSALGEAHIGVLEWFDEHHIPVDCIAGTSIGGLVGGAYACGEAPDVLKKRLETVDWQNALRGETPYSALAFRRKEDRRAIPNRFEFGVKHGLTLPGGLNPANAIGLLLSDIAYPCSTARDFDALPIPFRCIATDLATGQAVVMRDGSLPVALRATMSLPGIFTPVRRDGRLLSDGGIVENLPTEAVKEMGADTIIAVDLNSSSVHGAKDNGEQTLLSIIGRSVTLSVRANERSSLRLANVILAPDFKDINAGDFSCTDELVKRGYAAAEAQKTKLIALALSPADWATYTAARAARIPAAPKRPAFLTVAEPAYGIARRLTRELQPMLKETFPGRASDERFTLLTGGARFNAVLYEGVENKAGQRGVRVLAQETEYGPPFLHAGLTINGADPHSVQVAASARYIGLDAGLPGAETRGDISLGSNQAASGEYFVPLGESRQRIGFAGLSVSPLFVAPRVFYADNGADVFQNGSRAAVFGTQETGAAFDLGTEPSRFFETRLGASYERFCSSLRSGGAVPAQNGDVRSLDLHATWDRLDDGILPRSGFRATLAAIRYDHTPGGTKCFNTGELTCEGFKSHGKTKGETLFALASGGTAFGAAAPAPLQFTLGGPFRVGAANVEGLRGSQYYALTAGFLHQLVAPAAFGGRTLVGMWGEVGGTFGARFAGSDGGTQGALSGGLITETFLGPLLLGASLGDNRHGGLHILPYFVLGRLF